MSAGPQTGLTLGAIDGLGDAAKPGVQGHRLFRQDRNCAAAAGDPPVADARWDRGPQQRRPREDWIEIPVPALVSEQSFALAQELLERNKTHAPRRTMAPSLVQGLVSCSKCGYALSRTSTKSTARKIHYYRCLGSDAWRHLAGPLCDNRPVRQDLPGRLG